jgi:hypothetical protein
MSFKSILLGASLYFVFFQSGHTQDNPIPKSMKKSLNVLQTSVPFLTIAADSRAGAMGDLGAATTPDVNSQQWNAAKYPFIDGKFGVSIAYTPWLTKLVRDINLVYLSAFYKFDDNQVLSGSLRYFSIGEMIFRDEVGTKIGEYHPNEFAVDAAYSRIFSDRISGALTLRYIRSDITGGGTIGIQQYSAGNSFAADLSTYYHTPLQLGEQKAEFAWGLCISNLGTKISYTEGSDKLFIPTNLRLGARLTVELDEYNSLTGAFDLNKLLVPTPQKVYEDPETGDSIFYGKPEPSSVPLSWIQSFYDAPGGFNEEMREIMISAGVEYWYRQQFAIRGGYFYENESKGNRKYFTVGIGLQLNAFFLDFSYLFSASGRSNPLDDTMRFTLGANFGRKTSK